MAAILEPCALEDAFESLQTVPGCNHHILAGILHLSFRTRHNRRRGQRAGLMRLRLVAVQCAVHPAMIVAFEFQDAGTTGVSARQPVHQLHRLTAAGGESKALGTRHQRLDALRNRDLQLMLCPITERLLDLAAKAVHHGGMVVAENHRSPGELIVDVFIAIDIPQVRPLAVFEEEWNRGSGPEWAADSSCQRPA